MKRAAKTRRQGSAGRAAGARAGERVARAKGAALWQAKLTRRGSARCSQPLSLLTREADALRRERHRRRARRATKARTSRRCARRSRRAASSAEVVPFSAKIEAELAELPPEDRGEFLESLGLESAGLDRLIRAGYHLLGLQTYFTAGEQEVRAWTIHRGDTAPQAAGVIHTDFERGFIRAETVGYDDFVRERRVEGRAGEGRGAQRRQGVRRAGRRRDAVPVQRLDASLSGEDGDSALGRASLTCRLSRRGCLLPPRLRSDGRPTRSWYSRTRTNTSGIRSRQSWIHPSV